ncbi:hypothetical protein EJB05_06135 [Eragrostis curvula]|uniref:Uncharacterized protein n=1 Tax=Eragrostis curvula TaxID=38414 RepID=A0A5J9WD19_9POAL|nr:hypothetical protein EJB05_06135 [Eragrostis curvula]
MQLASEEVVRRSGSEDFLMWMIMGRARTPPPFVHVRRYSGSHVATPASRNSTANTEHKASNANRPTSSLVVAGGRRLLALRVDLGGDHGGLVLGGLEQEAPALVVDGDLERLRAEAVGDGEHDAAHLVAELGAVDGAAAVGVELLEDGVVERGDLGGERRRRGGPEPGAVEEAERLQRAAELCAGQHAVAVGVQVREPRVHAAREGRLVSHEGTHRRAVEDHHAHGACGGVVF